MNIAVLGTGMVGRALAGKLAEAGHVVSLGTRDVESTLARTDVDGMGNPPLAQWLQDNQNVQVKTFRDAAEAAEVVFSATTGTISLEVLESVGADALSGKVLVDVSLPLDLSEGMPPTLTVANTDSLGEQIQRAYPSARVVKTLNTVFAQVMVDPSRVPGAHNIFVAGDDAEAKRQVEAILGQFGWPEGSIIDLGDIRGARGAEMYARLYFQLTGVFGTFDLNIAIVR